MSSQRVPTAGRGAAAQRAASPARQALNVSRIASMGAIAVVVAVLVYLVAGGGEDYVVHVQLRNAGGLRSGFKVRVDGVPVGRVTGVKLGVGDIAIADATIDKSVVLGRDARATVRAVNLLGEKYLDITPGNTNNPAPSGLVIPPSRTGEAVDLDQVIDTLDVPTRAALNVVLDEGGRALAGRGQDFAATVESLPSSLQATRTMLDQLDADNSALGRLVDQSDTVVAAIAGQRAALGRTVAGADGTFAALAGRRQQLGATVQRAPGTLQALQGALTALQDAAVPLRPAAQGLRATAPALTSVLKALPPTATAAAPALRAARDVAPSLDQLAVRGTPVVRDLRPLASQLSTFSTGVDPATNTVDGAFSDMLGVMEAWARATAGHDASGHVFRLAVGGGADLLAALAAAGAPQARPAHAARPHARGPAVAAAPLTAPASAAPAPAQRKALVPKSLIQKVTGVAIPTPQVPLPGPTGETVNKLLKFLLGP